MEIISWEGLLEANAEPLSETVFKAGSAVTIGSFDGPHIAHKNIFDKVIAAGERLSIPAVIITFVDPLPAIKHSSDYLGDISTFNQRMDAYARVGFDYCVVVDFSFNFSKIKGRDFLEMLSESLHVRYISEGVDFHFGCNGSYRIGTIKLWAKDNDVETDFLDLVPCKKSGCDMITHNGETLSDTGRVSSSYIRQCIKAGAIDVVDSLLVNPYSIDFSYIDPESIKKTEKGYSCDRAFFMQVLPMSGVFFAEVVAQDKDKKTFLLRGRLEVGAKTINLVGLTGSEPTRIESIKISES